jgi:hypothetical protein
MLKGTAAIAIGSAPTTAIAAAATHKGKHETYMVIQIIERRQNGNCRSLWGWFWKDFPNGSDIHGNNLQSVIRSAARVRPLLSPIWKHKKIGAGWWSYMQTQVKISARSFCSRAASIQLSTSPTNCCGYWARKAPLDDNCRYPSPTLSFRRSITLSQLPWTLTLPEILAEPTAELHYIACSQRLHGAMGISQLKAQLTNRTCARYTRSAPRATPGRNSLLP